MKLSRYNLLIDEGDHLLIFNTISQALLYVSKDRKERIKKFFRDPNEVTLSEEEIEKLKKGMFVLDDDFDEMEYLKFRYSSYKLSDRFLRYTVVLTHSCNFDCVYCYQKFLRISNGTARMSDEVAQNLIRDARMRMRIHKPDVLSVTYYGGEPLLFSERLIEISKALKGLCEEMNVRYQAFVVTNGYLLDRETVDELVEVGIGMVEVTIDGTAETHDLYRRTKDGRGTFDVILRNIECASKKLAVQIRVNLCRENVESTERLIEVIAEKGLEVEFNFQPLEVVPFVPIPARITPLDEREFAEVEARLWWLVRKKIPSYKFEYFKRPRMARCDATCKNSFVVDVDGKIYKCWGEIGSGAASGVLTNEGMIQKGPFFSWTTYDPFEDEECRSCLVFPFCMGGCLFNEIVHERLKASPLEKPRRCISLRYNLSEFVKIITDYKLKGGKHERSEDGIPERAGKR